MRQAELAKLLGVDQTTVSLWECEKARPAEGNLSSILALLGCNPISDLE